MLYCYILFSLRDESFRLYKMIPLTLYLPIFEDRRKS